MKTTHPSLLTRLSNSKFIHIVLILIVLVLGAYFRFTGIKWDADFHLHPDERFLTMVESSITPVKSLSEYFNTSLSSLNPHNILNANGDPIYPFFVYGTLPIFIVRYIGEWLGYTGYGHIFILGRVLSGIFDLGVTLLVFFIAYKMFRKFWLGLLASFLYACSVMPIQISHYFVVDNFATFFSMLAFLEVVVILKQRIKPLDYVKPSNIFQWISINWRDFSPFVIFGIALGMAAASKINTVVIAFLLPFAVFLRDPKSFFNPSTLRWNRKFHYLLLAAFFFLLTFRIFQPYAFEGPGFFNIPLNPKWLANLKELSVLSSGDSNYPPSLQWARRSIWFPIKNLLIWGLGLPCGFFAILGSGWMGCQIIRGRWKKYSLIWVWTYVYLLWQVIRWNPTMRYLLLIYPTLVIIAAWMVVHIFKKLNECKSAFSHPVIRNTIKTLILLILVVGTACWALAFIHIYQSPMTRIAASEWIYDHIEGAVNLKINNNGAQSIQALSYPHYLILTTSQEFQVEYHPENNEIISAVYFDHIVNSGNSEGTPGITVSIQALDNQEIIGEISLVDAFLVEGDSRGNEYVLSFDRPITIAADKDYLFTIKTNNANTELKLFGKMGIISSANEIEIKRALMESALVLNSGSQYEFTFSANHSGSLTSIELFRVLNISPVNEEIEIKAELRDNDTGELLGLGKITNWFKDKDDFRGSKTIINLNQMVTLEEGKTYKLALHVSGENAAILITGSESAKESDWDDTLPLYMHGLNPFDNYEGIYQSDLNFQMYWDDNEDKRQRFISILDQADYIIITSNRQWGSVTQIPEKYPLSTMYYKELIGCPWEDVQWCYRVAEPDMFTGGLGYELIATYQSNPQIFGVEINSQFAEEAFTVYDHPKVLIFKKTDDFDLKAITGKFYQIDLSRIVNQTPEEAEKYKGDLTLSDEQNALQKSQGTWSDLFNYDEIQNKYPLVSVLVWYIAISLLGWMFYPLGRTIFKGLNDKGFALLKLTGLILWVFPVWLLGSLGVTVSKLTILLVLGAFGLLNLFIYLSEQKKINEEFQKNIKLFITTELISLVFFLFYLLIRLGNPDLWHPYKGGEKPMDFSYLNAVIKSSFFPPYDPWYAGGYINYYYYGFVLAAIPVKLLGIVPSIAYNLILATFFCFTGLTAFSFGWNVCKLISQKKNKQTLKFFGNLFKNNPLVLGLTTSVFILIIGNLGSVQMIIQGFQKIATTGIALETTNIFQKITLLIEGIRMYFSGSGFTYYPGDWYWIPSRVIPNEAITEFPYFTFLYGDPHAHLFAYPITILVLCWNLALLNNHLKNKHFISSAIQIVTGALLVGTLKPTNTWDYPVFLLISALVLGYVVYQYLEPPKEFFSYLPGLGRKVLFILLVLSIFTGLTYIFYYPFTRWFGQAYSSIELWKGDKTPIGSYITHWGFFLFIIYSFLVWELRDWMAVTPLSALKPYYKNRYLVSTGLLIIAGIALGMAIWGVQIVFISIPAMILLGFLFFRKDYSEINKFIILLAMAGLALTVMVEVIVLRGDIGRMNTVFKFYLQAWTFLAISSTIFLFHLLPNINKKWNSNWRKGWRTVFGLLIISVLLFPANASVDKITDRISSETPLTLDGMEYMKYSTYLENDYSMDLSQDHAAIRWMQDNVQGTPVIVEGTVGEYHWGNRFTIYTGLPGVIGWNWHQRQQRAINSSDWIYERIDDVNEFYLTTDIDRTMELINKYDVEYIIVGQLESAVYPGEGLEKFWTQNGVLWDLIYSSQETKIYQVN